MAEKKGKNSGTGKTPAAAPAPFMGYASLELMRDEMERMMQRFMGNDWAAGMGRVPMFKDWSRAAAEMPFAAMLSAPKADMSETDGEYELSVELPGLDEKDIELTLTDRSLVLKGEKKAEKESDDKDYHFSERSYGSIRRQFVLPENVDRDAMKAQFTKGVLKVTLPKTAESKEKSRRIEVTGA